MKLPITNPDDVKIGDIFAYYCTYSNKYICYKRASIEEANILFKECDTKLNKNVASSIAKKQSHRLPIFGINIKTKTIGWISCKETPISKITPVIKLLFMDKNDNKNI